MVWFPPIDSSWLEWYVFNVEVLLEFVIVGLLQRSLISISNMTFNFVLGSLCGVLLPKVWTICQVFVPYLSFCSNGSLFTLGWSWMSLISDEKQWSYLARMQYNSAMSGPTSKFWRHNMGWQQCWIQALIVPFGSFARNLQNDHSNLERYSTINAGEFRCWLSCLGLEGHVGCFSSS